MELKKNSYLVYLLCFLVVVGPGVTVLFGPKLKFKDAEHKSNHGATIFFIASLPFTLCIAVFLVDYFWRKK